MPNFRPRCLAIALLCALLVCPTLAQTTSSTEADVTQAITLLRQGNYEAALPLFEKLAAANPENGALLTYLALTVSVQARLLTEVPAKKKAFQRVRELIEKARKLGETGELIQLVTNSIPSEAELNAPPPKLTPAETALAAGEKAFASRDLKKALSEYERAAQLDPKLYEAPLYLGDVYFQQKMFNEAYQAYARAVAIDPDRDTAYRYWGNVLLSNGKLDEARAKFIEAVIANPYTRLPWEFLGRWTEKKGNELSHPRIDIPTNSVERKDDKNINITLLAGGKDDGSAAWTIYSIAKAGWLGSDSKSFKEAYPKETKYRHSLAEEMTCLRLTVISLEEQLKDKKAEEKKLDVSLANLLKLHRAGLLEPFLLFAKADEGLAQDYVEYRKTNRDKLRQYLAEYVAPNK